MRCFFYVQKMTTKLAFDRSVRTVDVDGRLRVGLSRISKSNVCPYLGREIPGAEALGLLPDQIYMLLRDPVELAKAADSFNSLPLLSKHVPVTADDHQPDLVVGSTGTDAAFDGTYLTNSLVVWESVAIAGIQSKEQCELSCAYRYTPDMTPGTFEGIEFVGRMTNIIGNHVALVETGRAGADVVVGDQDPFSKLTEQSPMTQKRISRLAAAMIASLGPVLALDASLKPLDLAAKLQLALDADPEKDDKEDKKPAAFDGDEQGPDESDEDYKKRMDAKKPAADEEYDKEDKKADKAAMDSAIRSAVSAAETATVKRMNAIRQAEREVQPLIGEVVAQDSAEAVYKLALDHAGVDLAGVPAAAFGAMVRMLSKPAEKSPRVAMDAASTTDFAAMFPTAGKVTRS
jgi:hypothetical protein